MKLFGMIRLFFALNIGLNALAASENTLPSMSLEQVKSAFKKNEKPSLLTGSFAQSKKIKELDVTIKTSGFYQIKKLPTGATSVLWKIMKPDPMQVCIDDEGITLTNPRDKKKNRLKTSEINQQDSGGLTKLIQLLKLNPENLHRDFTITQFDKKYVLKPKDNKGFQFIAAELELDARKNLRNVSLTEANGDLLSIQFGDTKDLLISNVEAAKKDCL